MNSGLLIVKEMMEKLPNSEKKIAHYILEHPQDTVSMTVTELGKKAEQVVRPLSACANH